jgi:H+-transporting ATPase
VTGDNAATAQVIAHAVGIDGPVAGPERLAAETADEALAYGVYARVFPEDKIRLVRLLQSGGHIVGMTGDGVNDAPALRQADMGIAVESATDVARAAAGVVLTAPGLTDIQTAIQVSRRIYQRMLTYTINKIIKTLEIAVFLTLGVIVAHAFIITPLLIVLLLFTNDFVTMAIATDHVTYSNRPDRWSVRSLVTTGALLAVMVLALSFSVFFVGRYVLHLTLPQLRTLIFVMLVATGQGNVYLVRERRRFWQSRPSAWMISGTIVDLLVVIVFATQGILMAPVSALLIFALLLVVASYLAFVDWFKTSLFHNVAAGRAPTRP